MPSYRFEAKASYDATTNRLYPGSTFTFYDSSGTLSPIFDLGGTPVTGMTANEVGMIPGFLCMVASVGYWQNAAGLQIPITSAWAQDPSAVVDTVKGHADRAEAAATDAKSAASDASGAVGTVASGLSSLAGTVGGLSDDLSTLSVTVAGLPGSGVSPLPGARIPIDIFASDFGGAWPTPDPRINGNHVYKVTFWGPASLASPNGGVGVSNTSAAGMQEGDLREVIG